MTSRATQCQLGYHPHLVMRVAQEGPGCCGPGAFLCSPSVPHPTAEGLQDPESTEFSQDLQLCFI